jgi:hypothetical protein
MRILPVALALAVAVPAFAEQKSQDKTPKQNKAKVSAKASVIAKDPVTGELRPATPAEVKALEEQSSGRQPLMAPVDRDRVETRPDGSKVGYLDETHMTHVVVKRAADGSLQYQCVDGDKNGNKVSGATKSAPAPLKVEER